MVSPPLSCYVEYDDVVDDDIHDDDDDADNGDIYDDDNDRIDDSRNWTKTQEMPSIFQARRLSNGAG